MRIPWRMLAVLVCGSVLSVGCTVRKKDLLVADVNIDIPKGIQPLKCKSPRPETHGCTTVCKPCVFWYCNGEEWVRVAMQWPDELCSPKPSSLPPTGCPRDPETGVCPAECHMCF